MLRFLLRGLAAIAVLIVVLACVAIGYRAWRQHETAVALAIHTPNGIEEASFLPVGGLEQWIQIRGEDRSNPVLLFVHGGPGVSETPMSALFRTWEKHFTVVMWDQRCAGKTFARNGDESCRSLSIAGVAKDGIALTNYLRACLHKTKIILLGHSWGTMVGVRMVHDRSDLYSAFVGTGFVVSIAEKEPVDYAGAMARLRAAHMDDGIRVLEKIGPPPWTAPDDIMTERTWSERTDIPSERDLFSNMTPLVLFAPHWSLWDTVEYLQAEKYAEAATILPDNAYDARRLGMKFGVPFFIFNGEFDHITPTELARPYFVRLDAPQKAFVVLKGAGHSAVLTEPDVFLRELVTRVRPVAEEAETGAK
ncbi:MAG: alpha/beta hydrolase [Rhizomicrobium sp.]|jgi:pimeloyl-ACP methyl ester carboxylesterase